MPIVPENIKNYFEFLRSCINTKVAVDDIKDINIRNLFPDCHVADAIYFVDEEFKAIQSISKDIAKKSSTQSVKSLELMAVIYKLQGMFTKERNVFKYMQKLSDITTNMEDRNYALASEAFWHMVHDSKTIIPIRSIELCQKIAINEKNRRRQHTFFLVDFAKIMFKMSNPDVEKLLENLEKFKIQSQSYFDKSSLDTYLSRAYLVFYTSLLQMKAQRLGKYKGHFSYIEPAQVIRKIAIKVLEHLKKKNSNLDMHGGSYETLFYTWSSVEILLSGMHAVAEATTMLGLDRESRQHQYEYFKSSIMYCVPHRTKLAIRMMMHCEYISQRIPELTIRDSQMEFLASNDFAVCESLANSYHRTADSGIEGYNLPIQVDNYDEFGENLANRRRNNENPNLLYINSSAGGRKELIFENCFLKKCFWRVELEDLLKVVKAYIWKTSTNDDKEFSVDNTWEKLFIEPMAEKENLQEDFINKATMKTPENSPKKMNNMRNKCMPMNAPARAMRRPLQMGPAHIKKLVTKAGGDGDNDDERIDGCNTVVIPYMARNIRYEQPETPRSILDVELLDGKNDGPSLIEYLERHADTSLGPQVPILHRPVHQRLALHYLAHGDEDRAAYHLSLSVNIGFRHAYEQACSLKVRMKTADSRRWNMAVEAVAACVASAKSAHAALAAVLPADWSVLQLAMVDEMPVRAVRSSLLDGPGGGCMGARNVAHLLVTKYDRLGEGGTLRVRTRIVYGFKRTGLALMDTFERYKMSNLQALALTDKRAWWARRFEIDADFWRLINQMRDDWLTQEDIAWILNDDDAVRRSDPKIIIADRHVGRLPWEAIFSAKDAATTPRCFSRMPNLASVVGHISQIRFRKTTKPAHAVRRVNLEIDPSNTFFLVNPDDSLQLTEDQLLPMFRDKLKWEGIAGSNSGAVDCLDIFNKRDMTLYCGHGSGSKYLTDKHLRQVTSPTALFLIGCYSARYLIDGRSEASSNMMRYLTNGCPTVVGLMWDVTDREIDRYTMLLLSAWLSREARFSLQSETYRPVAPLAAYVFSRGTAEGVRLQTLTGRAAVLYGLPVWVDPAVSVPGLAAA